MTCFYLTIKDVSLQPKGLFDSITPQIAENRTVANSLLLFLKYSAKYLFLKGLCQAVENLKYKREIYGIDTMFMVFLR